MTETTEEVVIEGEAPPKKKRKSRAKPKAPVVPPPHGTRARYDWKLGRCRCKECRAANTAWQQAYRDSKKSGRKRLRPRAIHGTRAKYVGGCRCEPCTKANRDYQRDKSKQYRMGITAKDLLPEDLSNLD